MQDCFFISGSIFSSLQLVKYPLPVLGMWQGHGWSLQLSELVNTAASTLSHNFPNSFLLFVLLLFLHFPAVKAEPEGWEGMERGDPASGRGCLTSWGGGAAEMLVPSSGKESSSPLLPTPFSTDTIWPSTQAVVPMAWLKPYHPTSQSWAAPHCCTSTFSPSTLCVHPGTKLCWEAVGQEGAEFPSSSSRCNAPAARLCSCHLSHRDGYWDPHHHGRDHKVAAPSAWGTPIKTKNKNSWTPHIGGKEPLDKLRLSFGWHHVTAGSPTPVYLKPRYSWAPMAWSPVSF